MLRKLTAAVIGIGLFTTAAAATAAGGAAAPSKATIKATSTGVKFKANRYIQDGLRWDKDVYKVKSGGTLHVVNGAADEGPHTFTVFKKSDVPKSFRCPTCDKLGKAHGADPESDAPPKFNFLENGVGQDTAPNVDRPGDSGVTGMGKKGEFINLKVTAKKGTDLYFVCLIHPWMQGEVKVG